MRLVLKIITVFAALVAFPAGVYAQGAITGVVRDSSGAVLPGVTVNATSPVLIEQVRTAVTDGTGQYRIVDLRPGTYVVTFELTGFNSLKREGIELSGDFVATVNAELRVGSVQETITVTGESPVVDVQSSQTSRTLTAEAIAGIPSSRNYQSFTVLMPGINVQGADVGGQSGGLFSVFQAHDGRRNEGQVQIDGLSAGWQGMGVSGYQPEVGAAEEVVSRLPEGWARRGPAGRR